MAYIKARFDKEADVWVTVETDVQGLTVEAESLKHFIHEAQIAHNELGHDGPIDVHAMAL